MPSCFNIPRNFNLSSGFVKPSAFCSSVGQCWIRLFGFAQTSAIHIIDTPWVLDRWRSAGLRPFSAMTIVAELSYNINIGIWLLMAGKFPVVASISVPSGSDTSLSPLLDAVASTDVRHGSPTSLNASLSDTNSASGVLRATWSWCLEDQSIGNKMNVAPFLTPNIYLR